MDVEVADQEVVEQTRNLPAVRASDAVVARGELTVSELVAQADKIKQVMAAAMKPGVHYGQVPGVNKPTLLKPGAELLNVLLRLSPSYESEKVFHDDGHLTVTSKCTLTHIPTGFVIAEGEGLCTSRESKYAYRKGGRVCPNCGEATIIKSKFPPRPGDYDGASKDDPPGWFCYGKKGGCGMNFAASDSRIPATEQDRTPNPDLPDTWNTVLKMADKRAMVAAVLNGTGASDVFTQDVEDGGGGGAFSRDQGANPFHEGSGQMGGQQGRGRRNVGAAAGNPHPDRKHGVVGGVGAVGAVDSPTSDRGGESADAGFGGHLDGESRAGAGAGDRSLPLKQSSSPSSFHDGKVAEGSDDFDPATDLLEGAVTAKGDYVAELQKRMDYLAPTLDWPAVIRQAWAGERTGEFWRRLSNCLEWIHRVGYPDGVEGDFPPIEDETIVAGFAWAFNGVVVEVARRDATDPEAGG